MSTAPSAEGTVRVLTTALTDESDVFALRRTGRDLARQLGLEQPDQIRLATALSELGRDRLGCTGVTVEFALADEAGSTLVVTLAWSAGAPPAPEALDSAQRLMRNVAYTENARRSRIVLRQTLRVAAADLPALAARVARTLRDRSSTTREEDLRAQTRDLIVALEEARARSEELRLLNEELEQTNAGVMALYSQLSEELEQTNSGVVALHSELDRKSRELYEAGEAKTRFWATVSHELRTPLNSVIGLARLLVAAPAGELGAEQRRQAALIAGSGEGLRGLVDELLDVAKAEQGRLVPAPAPIDLRLVLAQLDGTMQAAVPHSGVALSIPHPEGLPALFSDETMLIRILRNLVSNGLKFTASGSVSLTVRAADDRIVFTVADTGVGIPEHEQQRVFEEFYQVRGPHQRGRAGTGLGLPYARRLTELLGGTLTLRSEPGHGTTVTVDLPAGQPPEPAPPRRTWAVVVSADDDAAFHELIRPVLLRFAGRVVEIHDGDLVVDAMRRERADALFLDLDLPGLDGYHVLAQLADSSDLAAVPVIVISGYPADQLDVARLAHARAVLAKDGLTDRLIIEAVDAVTHPGHEGGSP